MPTHAVSVALDAGPPLSGDPLELAVTDVVAANPGVAGDSALDDLTNDVKVGLGLPPTLSTPDEASRLALRNPDEHDTGALGPFRTVVHLLLATPKFLRK